MCKHCSVQHTSTHCYTRQVDFRKISPIDILHKKDLAASWLLRLFTFALGASSPWRWWWWCCNILEHPATPCNTLQRRQSSHQPHRSAMRGRMVHKEPYFYQKSPLSFQKSPIFNQRSLYSIKRALSLIKGALHSIERALHSVKRALHPIKRAKYSIRKTLNSIKRALHFTKRALHSFKKNQYPINRAQRPLKTEP